jgi:hypothetical protein
LGCLFFWLPKPWLHRHNQTCNTTAKGFATLDPGRLHPAGFFFDTEPLIFQPGACPLPVDRNHWRADSGWWCGVRAAEAIKANPQKSNRAIAADIGIDQSTVSRIRNAGVDYATPERIGRDSKSYSIRQRVTDDPDISPEFKETGQKQAQT